jgi:ketosteroid isomerase-like protein
MDNVAFVRSIYEAFGRGDVPTVLAAMSPGIRWHEAEGNPYMPSGEAWVGPDALVKHLFTRIAAEWDGFTIHIRSVYGDGDTVIVEARYSGTYKPTGKSIDAQACHVWDVRNGKVVKFQQYTDTAQLQAAMGAPQT